jgi:hypothetical protein
VTPLAGLGGLNTLWLSENPLSGIAALGGLFNLTTLHVSATGISDLGPLGGLTVLLFVDASDNPLIQNIQPLLDNPGVGSGDTVDLSGTGVSCPSVAQLKQKGVAVISDCP